MPPKQPQHPHEVQPVIMIARCKKCDFVAKLGPGSLLPPGVQMEIIDPGDGWEIHGNDAAHGGCLYPKMVWRPSLADMRQPAPEEAAP
jgi:hypothetical protein